VCLYYATYFVGVHADPATFPLSSPRRDVVPSRVISLYKTAYPSEPLTHELDAVYDDSPYKDWAEIRNILSHRGHGGRTVYAGGDQHGQADWNLPLTQTHAANVLRLDELERRRTWLIDSVTRLVKRPPSRGAPGMRPARGARPHVG